MVSRRSLRSLELLSRGVLAESVNELVICTTHVPNPVYDNFLNERSSSLQLGKGPEEANDLLPSISFAELGAENFLVDALSRLPSCKKVRVTDSDAEEPCGLSQLQQLIAPGKVQTSICGSNGYDGYNSAEDVSDHEGSPAETHFEPRQLGSENFVYTVVRLTMSTIAQCSNVTSFHIEVGSLISSPAIQPIALVLPAQKIAPLNFQEVTSLTMEVDPRDTSQVCHLRDFFHQFSRIQFLDLKFWPPDEPRDGVSMLDGLEGLRSECLRSLKISDCHSDYTDTLARVLQHHRSTLRELSLTDFGLVAREDWIAFLGQLNKELTTCTVQLRSCSHLFSRGPFLDCTLSVGTSAGGDGFSALVDILNKRGHNGH